jgi:formylglycine-generating enzyme required for sulfatase activity
MNRIDVLFAMSVVAACTTTDPPAAAPARGQAASMAIVPPGSFVQGHDDAERPDERPAHEVRLPAFAIDLTLVTRAAFAGFVAETAYVTTAERMGFGMASREGMDDWAWERVPHASWRAPFIPATPGSEAFLRDDAPVVMVTFEDAVAYCAHQRKRLPTEAEWEYAMRAGRGGTRYPWGDSPLQGGRLALNFWQGASHHHNDRDDGFVYVSPVEAFPPNAWGIRDPVGNVWQWTADAYDPRAYERAAARAVDGATVTRDRVLRGGSWWCGPCTCEGNGLFYRGHADPRAAYNNNGFRCASDAGGS